MELVQDLPTHVIRMTENICEAICQRCWKFAADSDEHPQELDRLTQNFVELYGAIGCLNLVFRNPAAGTAFVRSGVGFLYDCDVVFERILSAFDRHDAATLERDETPHQQWPFTEKRCRSWIAAVEDLKDQLSSLLNQKSTSSLLSKSDAPTAVATIDDSVDFKSMLQHLGDRWMTLLKSRNSSFLRQRVNDLADLVGLAMNHIDPKEVNAARYDGMQVLSLAIIIENDRFLEVCVDKFDSVDIRDVRNVGPVGYTPLELAAERGVPGRIFQKMLTKTKAPDAKNGKGWSPIHTACERGHLYIVEGLLDVGVDINLQGYEGMNPLLMGASNQQPAIVESLISKGADVHAVNKHHWNACHFAVHNGDLETMAVLKKSEIGWNCDATGVLNGIWHSNMRPVHFAATIGSREALHYLYDNGLIDDINCKTQKGLTAVHFAVIENHLEALKYLLFVGADPNIAWISTYPTPLHLAARFGPSNLVSLLLEHNADAFAMNALGLTPQAVAKKFKHHDIVEMLKNHGAGREESSRVPVQSDQSSLIRTEDLAPIPSPKFLRDSAEDNRTLRLLHCVANGTIDACKSAIDDGADLKVGHFHNPDMQSICCTPLLIALNRRRPSIAKLLILSGAPLRGKNCRNSITLFGYTAMHLAARFGYTDVLGMLVERSHELEPLLKQCPVHPVHLAVAFNQPKALRVLLGLDVHAVEDKQDFSATLSSVSWRTYDGTPRRRSVSLGPISRAPVYPKISLQHIEIATLDFYNLPWEYQQTDPSYIIILRELSVHETDALFEHTRKIRERRSVRKTIEIPKKTETPEEDSPNEFTDKPKEDGETRVKKRTTPHPLAVLVVGESRKFPPFDCERLPILSNESSSRGGPAFFPSAQLRGTPLHIACSAGNKDLVKLLLDEAAVPVDILDSNSMTPLHRAADYGHLQIIDLLLSRGANMEARNDVLETPLLIAADAGELSTVEYLIKKHGANPRASNILRINGLLRAVEQDNAPMISYFANLYATIGAGDGDGAASVTYNSPDTPTNASENILQAVFYGANCDATVAFLLNAIDAIDLAASAACTGSALHAACAFVRTDAVKRILRRLTAEEKARMLGFRAQVHGTPLYIAAGSGSVEIVRLLLGAGAKLDIVGGEEGTAIMVAARYQRIDVVRLLLQQGAKMSCIDDGNMVKTLWAAAEGDRANTQTNIETTKARTSVLSPLQKWLLVGRFVESPRLLRDVEDTSSKIP